MTPLNTEHCHANARRQGWAGEEHRMRRLRMIRSVLWHRFSVLSTSRTVRGALPRQCWPTDRKKLRTLISIVCVAFALEPMQFNGQNRSSEVVKPTKQPCDRSAQQRLALVIGNGAYAIKPLRNPPNDATAVADELRDLGFVVTSGVNKSQLEMEQMIREFGQRLRANCGVGLFYYAGHGVQISRSQLPDSGQRRHSKRSRLQIQDRRSELGARIKCITSRTH